MTAATVPPAAAGQVIANITVAPGLEITVVPADARRVTVQLGGEIDLANAGLLTAVVDHQLGLGRRDLRLDLSRVSFLDCAALRALVHSHNHCLIARGTMVLTGLTRRTAKLLRITHLDQALFVADMSHDPTPPRTTPLPRCRTAGADLGSALTLSAQSECQDVDARPDASR